MKSIIGAFVGAASATTYTIPSISWNQTAIDNVVAGLDTYAQQAAKDDQADQLQSGKDLVNIYAAWEVNNYMTFGNAVSPVVQSEVDFLKAFSVNSTCNETIATQCLNQWLINGAQSSTQKQMETCIKTNATCTTKWDDMTYQQKADLAEKYKTNVRTMGLAYKKVHDKIMLKLATAWADHMKRRQAMNVKFLAASKTAFKGMGCDSTCVDYCYTNYSRNPYSCVTQWGPVNGSYGGCQCGTNVVKFTPGGYSSYYEKDFISTQEIDIFQ